MTIPSEIAQWRKALRANLVAQRLAADDGQRKQWNAAITNSLIECFPLLQWMVVGFYWPYKGEFDARFAMRHLRQRGATAALPVVIQKREPLQFRMWWPGTRMTKGVFDLPIPENTAVVKPQALLISPIGFDSGGYRLGYGGGYFDRTLASMAPQPLKIGVAFELARIPSIAPQSHDIPMDFIVTERGAHRVTGHGLELIRDRFEVLELASRIVEERHQMAPMTFAHESASNGAACVASSYASPPCYASEMESYDHQPSS